MAALDAIWETLKAKADDECCFEQCFNGWLWCCGRSCWWCYRRMTLSAGSTRSRRRTSERRVQSRSTPSDAKPGSLWTCGPAPSPAATPRPPDCTKDHHTLQHIHVHFGVDFQADFEDMRWHDVALTGNHTKDHNRSRELCFHHPGHVPVIRGNPDLHFEGADNGPVVITWIGRDMSWRAAHLQSRSLNIVSLSVMIEGSYRSWDLYTTGQLVDSLQQKKNVFIKRKWNQVVFSRATILSFHPVYICIYIYIYTSC